jgi:diguanylate cyclase (GGDEF)-like protein
MKSWLRLSAAIIVLLGLLSGSNITAQAAAGGGKSAPYDEGVRFEHLTVEDGLPHSTVLSVLQDQQGFMWFATADGVSRYDGYSFTTFHHDGNNPNSLSNNNTFALVESHDGLIWIGTDPGGLDVYDPETGKFSVYVHAENDPQSLADNSVWSLMEAKDGAIWAGTRGGLSRLDRQTGKFKNYLVDAKNPRALAGAVVYRIYQDRAGTIWVATRNGLQRYDPQTDDFTLFANNPKDSHSISSSNVWAMLEDREGVFWVGTRGGGLNRFDRASGTFKAYQHDLKDAHSLSDNNVWNVYEDSAGRLWVVTENGGLNLFDRQTETFTSFQHNPNDPFSVSNNDLYWLTEDRSGVLWITSRYGGVNKFYPGLWRFGLYRSVAGDSNSLSSNNVYSVLADPDGVLWIGTFGGGINRFDRTIHTNTVYQNDPKDDHSLSNDKVQYLFRDEKGVLWASTSGGGLNRLDPRTGKFSVFKHSTEDPDTLSSNFLTTIATAANGRLWVGTLGYGLDLFNPQTGKVEKTYANNPTDPNSLTEDTVYDLAVDAAGRVWIATARGGLELLDPKTGQFTHHRAVDGDENTILGDTVHSIFLDEAGGMVWAGTASGLSGLNLATQQWQNYTTRDGLPNDTVVGVEPGPKGELWVSTGKGISHFNIAQKTFTNYDARDGLQGDQFEIASSSSSPDGEIYFGGSNGLTVVHPNDLAKNAYLPPVVFTDFQLFNQSIPVGSAMLPKPVEKTQQIILQYDQSVFTIQFAALSYQLSSKNLYQYKMVGFDKDWSPPRSKREVTYTNLPAGEYTFMVRAANNDGVWNDTAAQVMIIKVLPPWWETWWFRGAIALLLIGLIYGGVNLRIRNINAMNRTLERRVTERTQELEDAQDRLSMANEELQSQLDEITDLEKVVREMAIHDALTNLYNRHYLSERLPGEFNRAQHEHHCIAFLLMDIDHFKMVNDRFGHQNGDLALRQVSQIVLSRIRESDIACRYGGEEFMVIMANIEIPEVLERAEQLRQAIEALRITDQGQEICITASIGVAIYPLHGGSQDQILSCADAALYQAKHAGRNQVVLYQPEAE